MNTHSLEDPMRSPILKSLLDCHVHLAAFPNGDNGCYLFEGN